MIIIEKIKVNGLKETIFSIFKRVKEINNYFKLTKNDFIVNFLHEGNLKIKIPKQSIFKIFSLNALLNINRDISLINRPNSEVLFRKTIYDLYYNNYINNKKSIIDIGCWIGDNSLIWAKFLKEKGVVFAIDPSKDNLLYGKKISVFNNIKNIEWINAICSEKEKEKLEYDGLIHHARFKTAGSSNFLLSTTLDTLIYDKKNSEIGFIHIDVEGFELKVLKGALKLIKRDKPFIAFEQHISRENVENITKVLKNLGYKIFMINEVLPNCDLDCRNFISIHKSNPYHKIEEINKMKLKKNDFYHAIIGPRLIEI